MISNPHEHQLGVALVTSKPTAEEQRAASLEVGEDSELLRAWLSKPYSTRTTTGQISCSARESDLLLHAGSCINGSEDSSSWVNDGDIFSQQGCRLKTRFVATRWFRSDCQELDGVDTSTYVVK